MLGKKVTLLVMPEGPEGVRYYKCPRFLPFAVILLTALALAGMAGFSAFMYYRSLRADTSPDRAAERLRRVAVKQDLQIKAFAEKIRLLELEMIKLRQYDRRLQTMTGAEPAPGEAESGVGGSESDVDTPRAMLKSNTSRLVKQMHRDLDRLLAEAGVRECVQHQIGGLLRESNSILAATPDIWPLRGPITSYFGYRNNPFSGRGSEFHRGLDISAPAGTPIMAPADGKVVAVEWNSGYGHILVINHGYGLVTRYAHISQALVEPDQVVRRGQKIALVGSTGRATGPHLHYEAILNGIPVNPLRYLEAKK